MEEHGARPWPESGVARAAIVISDGYATLSIGDVLTNAQRAKAEGVGES